MDIVTNNYGLAFSISPTKKRIKKTNDKDEDDEEYTLTLAPFTKAPKINFGEVKVNTIVERTVLIINPQQFDVKLNVTNQDLEINNLELNIGKMENVYFKIKWQPEKPNNYKYSIMFEVTNSARLKFLVHAFGVCIAPVQKKIRKPVTMLQPLKREKTQNQTAAAKPVQKNPPLKPVTKENVLPKKTTQSITATIKPAPSVGLHRDKTFLVQPPQTISNKNSSNHFGAKLSKTPSVDIYNLYDAIDDEEHNDTLNSINHMDLRRQTCIIASPKIVKNKDGTLQMITNNNSSNSTVYNNYNMRNMYMDDFNFKINDFQKTPLRRSLSSGNLDSTGSLSFVDATLVVVAGGSQNNNYTFNTTDNNQTVIHKNYSPSIFSTVKKQIPESCDTKTNLTPKLIDFLKPTQYQAKKQDSKPIATQLNYDYDEEQNSHNEQPQINSTILIEKPTQSQLSLQVIVQLQKQWRMKRFRNSLRQLKYEVAQDAIRAALANTQRIIDKEREKEKQIVERGFSKLQKQFRMNKFRKCVSELREIKNKQIKQEQFVKAVILIQKQWRMKQFRKKLKQLKIERELEELNRISLIIICQRAIRMKLFRIHLNKMRQYQSLLINTVINCQSIYRMKKFRQRLAQLKSNQQQMIISVNKIKHQWHLYKFRKQMKLYKKSALCIQAWVRSMKQRFLYLRLKRGTILIQKKLRARLVIRNKAALTIQTWYRTQHHQHKFQSLIKSILIIQKWYRSKSDRFKFLKFKRATQIFMKQNHAAEIIQRQWRLFKFRSQMNKYRKAIQTIQRWHRSMKLRYDFLRKRDIICRIQLLYRRLYMVRRHSAALKIQCAWRVFQAVKEADSKRNEYEVRIQAKREKDRIHRYATMIQACWRGYIVRKDTNQILNRIRNRLSCYVQGSSLSNYQARTLGARIRNSLKILSCANVPIQQIIIALVDLDKVTRLSPECCQIFVREGALIIIYNFILNCNRSVPHMDLIKLCLKILINLAKYNETVIRLMEPSESLSILTNLLLAYHSSNPVIFMDACILFILMAQCKQLYDWFLSKESLINTLLKIHSTLERRTILKLKQTSQPINPLSANPAQQQALNTTICGSAQKAPVMLNVLSINKKALTVSFTISPEWSLSKKSTIDLVDPIGALDYFLSCLKIKTDSILTKTPKKMPVLNIIKEIGSCSASKTKEDVCNSAKTSRIPFSLKSNKQQESSSSSHILFKQQNKKEENTENESSDYLDDQVSILSNESYSNMTIKSIASSFYNEDPKLNSTSISYASTTTRHQLNPRLTQTAKKENGHSSKQTGTANSRRKLI